jgi:hypothetical protein
MKTTVEISEALLRAAKRRARARGVTLRALIEEGLRSVLREDEATRSFRLRRASFGGKGRAEGTEDWESVRDLIYSDRRS